MASNSQHTSLLGVLVMLTVVAARDDIVLNGAKGRDVVEAVCNVIEASCVFADDKLFTRRLAYIESNDGGESKTYRPGYYGGIWQLDEAMFNVTKSVAAATYLSTTFANISKAFNISWPTVSWSELTKPLYSAIGARLFLQYQSRNVANGIPRATVNQAQFWVNHYRPMGSVTSFVQTVDTLSRGCVSAGSDIVFVLDASGSIGSSNFEVIRNFVKAVVGAFDVGPDNTRFGLVVYDNSASRPFDLNTYNNKAAIQEAVGNIPYTAGGTQTDAALDVLVGVSFTSEKGARPVEEGHPRVAIVITDGASNNRALTLAAAQRLHDANIIAFAIGVGTSLDVTELTAIASKPTCTYKILLSTGFSEVDSLVSVIQKKACRAPIILAIPTIDGNDEVSTMEHDGNKTTAEARRVTSVIPVGESQNCQIKVPVEGTTFKLAVDEGATEEDVVSFYTSTITYPSEAFYDRRVDAWVGHQAVTFLSYANTTVYCNYRSTARSPTVVSMALLSGDKDVCQSRPCLNNGTCSDQDNTFVCLCPADYTGSSCEVKRSPTQHAVPSSVASSRRVSVFTDVIGLLLLTVALA